ncbi:MAG TPA: class I SAM-dependent methyltransferase [Candidatus Paceibacterota bacterium]|nr:class I SAM-dependent methyltransferase [Candidatus Paceibacterota bacterium]
MDTKDRFIKIAENYEALFEEVFAVQGLDYRALENSIFDQVALHIPKFLTTPILDVGIGDGASSKRFVEAGCTLLTGVDLNPLMLQQAKAKYGEKIKLLLADATNLHMFNAGDFPVIITAFSIHNIAKKKRPAFWKEVRRLSPRLLVMCEKIADADLALHQKRYESEINAIDLVYRQRHGNEEVAKEWREHYEWDEKERLELEEIQQSLGDDYGIQVVFEMGMSKTVLCKKKM